VFAAATSESWGTLCNILKTMSENELHFYSNKRKAFLLLTISTTFLVCGFLFWKQIIDFSNHPIKSSIFLLGLFLFTFGVIMAVILLIRRKPMLSLDDSQIIIYDIFRKPIFLNFTEIKSFELFELRSQYSTNREILIELKNPTKKIQTSLYYKLMKRISLKIANTRYSIRPQFINVDRNKLMEILNLKLKNVA
jgi:hypothetical protein